MGSFCHVNLSVTPGLALHNLWRNLHMFLDILKFKEEKRKNKEITVFKRWNNFFGKMALTVCKITSKKYFLTCDKWNVTGAGRWTFSQNFSSLALVTLRLKSLVYRNNIRDTLRRLERIKMEWRSSQVVKLPFKDDFIIVIQLCQNYLMH